MFCHISLEISETSLQLQVFMGQRTADAIMNLKIYMHRGQILSRRNLLTFWEARAYKLSTDCSNFKAKGSQKTQQNGAYVTVISGVVWIHLKRDSGTHSNPILKLY